MSNMRAKFRLTIINKQYPGQETLNFVAVSKSEGYPSDGSDENNTYAMWTPMASLTMTVTNPALVGVYTEGQQFYVDFTPVQ